MRIREKILKKALKGFFKAPIHTVLLLKIQELLDYNDTVLDLGCGLKILTCHLCCRKLTGIDVEKSYLTPQDICGDIRNLKNLVLVKSHDWVIAIDVIEHLNKEEGKKLISDMIGACRKGMIFFTPTVWNENVEAIENEKFWSHGNEFNLHKSLWTERDFIVRGFKIIDHPYKKDYILAYRGR